METFPAGVFDFLAVRSLINSSHFLQSIYIEAVKLLVPIIKTRLIPKSKCITSSIQL